MKKNFQLFIYFLLSVSGTHAQNSFEDFKKRAHSDFHTYKHKVEQNFDAYRKRINEEFAEYIRATWVGMESSPEIPQPKDDNPIPPIIYNREKADHPIEERTTPFEDIIRVPQPEPQPEPIVPIVPIEEKEQTGNRYSLTYMGNDMSIRIPQDYKFTLHNCSENNIADAWRNLSNSPYDNTLADLLNLRKDYRLCDWAYLNLLKTLAYGLWNGKTNEATLLIAYLYAQSGYMMKLAQNKDRLYMLFGSKFVLYNKPYWNFDDYYYYNMEGEEMSLKICNIKFPKEQALSLYITQEQRVPETYSTKRTLQSEAYPEMRFTIRTNMNLIEFYSSYPTGYIGKNECTRWAVYANTPINEKTRNTLYASLRHILHGKSQKDAANMLLNFVQTSLVYEYDEKIWGGDRAFFPEETLHYPYADCEDRAILFTRLIRDLLHLKTALVFYPGHLASAIQTTDPDITGDFININGERYLVCDPTFINAPIGCTMTGMDNSKAKVIRLD